MDPKSPFQKQCRVNDYNTLTNVNERIPPCYRARSLSDPSRNVWIYKNKLVSKKLMDPEKERDENDYYHQRGD